ncbi:MAG: VIT1/CCC1 transporter family protein [Candidatus Magasanikbacteria bacterium]|nr:VIT1/CCC1 transporter family protein [Candidatus Magasanikbacteria bacterium]
MSVRDYHHRPDFVHHQNTPRSALIREVVFGMEDGMVSTLGALTGIAAASQQQFTVLLSGLVLIAVESLSMAVGSYLSNKSERDIDRRKLAEEQFELKQYPQEEQEELAGMYVKDGWPRALAEPMAAAASRDKNLFLQEMAYRELKVFPDQPPEPLRNGIAMGIAYILGGAVPLIPYLAGGSVIRAIPYSIAITLLGLFMVGVATTRYSRRSWWKAGLEMVLLATVAAAVGYLVGQLVGRLWLN